MTNLLAAAPAAPTAPSTTASATDSHATLRRGRPWALTGVWILLMAVFSIAGRFLQEPLHVDPTILPLVMLGPGVAWLICRLAVPSWFPEPAADERSTARTWWAAWPAMLVVCGAFVITMLLFAPQGTPGLPAGMPTAAGVLAVIAGLTLGCWAEEVGYRGVMYRALARPLGVWPAIVLNGLFFGLAHLQYFASGWGVLLFMSTTLIMDVCMVAVWHGSWAQRVALVTVLHTVSNVAMQFRGLTLDKPSDFLQFLVPMAAATVVAVILGLVLRLGDLRKHTA